MVPMKADHLSRTSIARRLQQPTRDSRRCAYMARAAPRPLFGLAPSGVYRAAAVTSARGGLLHHRFTLACAPMDTIGRPSAVCSLLHFPSPYDARLLAGTLPCGARTFLESCDAEHRDSRSTLASRILKQQVRLSGLEPETS